MDVVGETDVKVCRLKMENGGETAFPSPAGILGSI